jgi:hypothetical protein
VPIVERRALIGIVGALASPVIAVAGDAWFNLVGRRHSGSSREQPLAR